MQCLAVIIIYTIIGYLLFAVKLMLIIYIISCDYLTVGVCCGMASDLARSVARHTHTCGGAGHVRARDGSYVV